MSKIVDDDLYYKIANLYPRETGLPMTVWVSPRGRAQHDVRIKVHTTQGNRMIIANAAVVAVRPTPHLVEGQLAPADEQAVFRWIGLNEAALVAYWEGTIGTIELAYRLHPLPP